MFYMLNIIIVYLFEFVKAFFKNIIYFYISYRIYMNGEIVFVQNTHRAKIYRAVLRLQESYQAYIAQT